MKETQKKTYEKPEMKTYGDIKKITKNIGKMGQDASDQSGS